MDPLTVATLAEVLQESNRPLLTQVLRTLGPDRTRAMLTATLEQEAAGGLRTRDGTRRRTPGGAFFQFVKERATPHERRRLFLRSRVKKKHPAPTAPPYLGRGAATHQHATPRRRHRDTDAHRSP